MSPIIDITGNKYGKLTVNRRSELRNISGDILWECVCDCGNLKYCTSGNLRNGDAKSCGCIRNVNYDSFIGNKYGRLTILSFTKNKKKVRVSCECNRICLKNWSDVKSGHTKSCGCLGRSGRSGVDLTGIKFGKLLVIEKSNKRNKYKDVLWLCKCDCGKNKLCTTGALQHGGNTSCGCTIGGKTHGDWNLRIRRIWVNMIARCNKPNSTSWHNYGAKGITVCVEWNEYSAFKLWAYSNGYADHLTLDRYPNKNGNYSPDNCRWATYKQQANNKSSNRIIRFNGELKTLSEWADIYNINQQRVRERLSLGWPIRDALTKPIDKNKISKRYRK
jgi:hypothetical protein